MNNCRYTLWAIGLLLILPQLVCGQSIRTIALSGQHPGGLPEDLAFDEFLHYAIGPQGRVAFLAGERSNYTSLWLEDDGYSELIAHKGGTVFDSEPTLQWTDFSSPAIFDAHGDMVFRGNVTGLSAPTPIWSSVLVRYDGERTTEIYRSGDAAPGHADKLLVGQPGTPGFYNTDVSGGVMFRDAYVQAGVLSSPVTGNWYHDPGGELMTIGDPNQSVPVLGGEILRTSGGAKLAPSGDLGVFATLSGDSVTEQNDKSYWWGEPDALSLVAREGQQAAGLPEGVLYESFHLRRDH